MKQKHKLFRELILGVSLAAWMTVGALAAQVGIGTVSGSAVNVRALPSLSGARMTQLTKGTDVLIFGQEGDWYAVSVNGKLGYMSADYVKEQADKTGEFGYGKVLYETPLFERSDAEFPGAITLAKGQGLKVLGAEAGWFVVQLGADKGYLPQGSLEPAQPTAEMIAVYAAHAPGQVVAETAKKYLGVRYVWGGTSPKYGFDCSGLVQYVYKESLNYTFTQRTSQYRDGVRINRSELLPGDLVTFATATWGKISHIGIYLGDGKFIHAPRPGASVRIDDMTSGYYYARFHSAYRVVG